MYYDDTIRRMAEAYRPMQEEIDRNMRFYKMHFDDINRNILDAYDLTTIVKDLFPTRNIVDTFAARQLVQLEDFGHVRGSVERIEKLLGETTRDWQLYASDYLDNMTRALKFSMNEEVRSISDSFARLAGIQKSSAGEQVRSIARELVRYNDLANEYSRWIRELHNQLAAEDVSKFLIDANELIGRLSGLYSELPLEDLEGDTSLAERRQAANLIAEKMEEIVGSKDVFRLPALIERLLEALKSGAIKLAPKAQKLFYDLLVGIIASLIASAIGLNPQEFFHKRPVKRDVISAIKEVQKSSPLIPADVRVVLVNEYLVMRAGAGKNNPEVGRLYPGDVVTVLKVRGRSWALVEFEERHSETLLRGWVFNRYLRSLRGRR